MRVKKEVLYITLMRWLRFTVKNEEFLPLKKDRMTNSISMNWMTAACVILVKVKMFGLRFVWLGHLILWIKQFSFHGSLTDNNFSFCVVSQLRVYLTHSFISFHQSGYTMLSTRWSTENVKVLSWQILRNNQVILYNKYSLAGNEIKRKTKNKNITFDI